MVCFTKNIIRIALANPAVVLLVVNPEFRPLETHIDLTPSFTTQGFQGSSPLLVSCRPISFFRTQLTCWKSTRALMIARGVSLDSSAPPLWTKPEVNERRHSVS